MNRVCFRCGYSTTVHQNFKKHLFRRKNRCKAKFLDISPEDVYNKYDEYLDDYLQIRNPKEYSCEKCGMTTIHKSNYYRHKRNKVCEEVRAAEVYNIGTINDNSVTNNIDNSVTNNDNSVTRNTNNIINYGQQINIDIPLEKFIKICHPVKNAVVHMVEEVHVNTPQNRNILVPSRSRKEVSIFKDDVWVTTNSEEPLEEIFTDNCDRVDDLAEHYKDQLSSQFIYELERETQYSNNQDRKNKVKKDIHLLLYNKKHIIKSKSDS